MERLARQIIHRLTIRRLLVAAVLYWTPVVLLAKLTRDVAQRDPMAYDTRLLQLIHLSATPGLNWCMIQITTLGDAPFVGAMALFGTAALIASRRYRDALQLAAGVGGAVALDAFLKLGLARPRPHLWDRIISPSGYAFPSAHATMSAALAISLVLLAWPTRWRGPALVLAVAYIALVGFSRLYLGVHYPTDVVGGWCLAVVWVLLVAVIMRGRWVGLDRR